ncbi:tetratricopeptide repeat protein [Novosphingobium sp. M1R2S20]|uniref:Tetratricopeptide repeat protein n=1 Tax=Novosphingobium rhizovicinum TaxID=3228928 RepID=A0ABV3R9Z3_9SPHN
MSLFLLILQYGATVSQLPPEILDRKAIEARRSTPAAGPVLPPVAGSGCIDEMISSPAAGAIAAQKALDRAKGEQRVRAGLCLGAALGAMERWDEARTAFLQARDAAAATDVASRARLGAMAGNAALAAGSAEAALAILDTAQADARSTEDNALTGTVAIDRARALVALGRQDQAATALTEARAALPDNAQAWLLSATLSRRADNLSEAQAQIERAAQLSPRDPEIGLEAGVIAVLDGREDAARKSWQSVVDGAPQSEAAETASGYLAQLEGTAPRDNTP